VTEIQTFGPQTLYQETLKQMLSRISQTPNDGLIYILIFHIP